MVLPVLSVKQRQFVLILNCMLMNVTVILYKGLLTLLSGVVHLTSGCQFQVPASNFRRQNHQVPQMCICELYVSASNHSSMVNLL